MPYLLLLLASLLFVACVAFAYEVGKRVGTYETQRNYRHPNWRVNPKGGKR